MKAPCWHTILRLLVCARLRHVVSTAWGTKRYMSMKALNELQDTMIPVG